MRRQRPHSVRGRPAARATRRSAPRPLSGRSTGLRWSLSYRRRPTTTKTDSTAHRGSEIASTTRATRRTRSSTHPSSSSARPQPSLDRGIRDESCLRWTVAGRWMRPAANAAALGIVCAAGIRAPANAGLAHNAARMRMRGLEPPRPYGHTDLNRARLPIPPHPRGQTILARRRLTPR